MRKYFNNDIPQVSVSDLKPAALHRFSGGNNLGIYEGKLDGKPVIVKVVEPLIPMDEDYAQLLADEISYQAKTSKVRVGERPISPEFFGVMTTSDGKIGIVTENISPSFFIYRFSEVTRPDLAKVAQDAKKEILETVPLEVRLKWANRIREIVDYFNTEGTRMIDMQFLGRPDGEVLLIDLNGNIEHASPEMLSYNDVEAKIVIDDILGR